MDTWIFAALVVAYVAFRLYKRLVTAKEAKRLVAAGAALVDVRSAAEFSAGHIPGAVNIPLPELSKRSKELGPRERAVVVYCASGARSASAAMVLRSAGYKQVLNLGPMAAW